MITPTNYIEDEIYGRRLLISVNADQRELKVSRGDRHLSYGIRYPQAPVPMTTKPLRDPPYARPSILSWRMPDLPRGSLNAPSA